MAARPRSKPYQPNPEQLALFIDGNGPSVINRMPENKERLDFLNQVTSALPYHLSPPGRVLIPASGGGTDLLQALNLSNADIDAVELNPQIIDLVQSTYGEYAGQLYTNKRVRVFNIEIRGADFDINCLSVFTSMPCLKTGITLFS